MYNRSNAGAWLERVQRVPDTLRILTTYIVAPVKFWYISIKRVALHSQNFEAICCGTRGLKFLTRPLVMATKIMQQ